MEEVQDTLGKKVTGKVGPVSFYMSVKARPLWAACPLTGEYQHF